MQGTEFERLADPFRRELLAHCYRLLGSLDDAEDQVQETYLRAWRAFEGFEGRSSLRTWLYRIATNACLTALESRGRRPLPAGVPTDDEPAVWEQADPVGDPATVLESREHRRAALDVAWEQLAPRPRAVLMLRDVLGWRATEVAELLGGTDVAVHTALRRARAQLAAAPADEAPATPARSELLDRYATAFEEGDIGALVQLVSDDAVFESSSASGPLQLRGHRAIGQAMAHCPVMGECKLVPITVRRRSGFAVYRAGADGVHRAYAIELVAVTRSGAEHIEVIESRDAFATLGLPRVHLAAS